MKEGNDQQGIDVLSVQRPGGKHIAIQCKKVESFTESNVKSAIEAFVDNHFIKEASVFILAVSTSVGERAKKYLLKSQKELRQQFNVDFQTWDSRYLEEQLRKEYTLVSFFFNEHTAQNHCFAPSYTPKAKEYEKPKHYISRRITAFRRIEHSLFKWWHIDKASITTLSEVLHQERLKPKHICLIGDAYQGKTYLFRYTAHELQNSPVPFSPLLIELKYQVVQPLETLLNLHFGIWKNVPAKDIVLLVDGMDEVPSEKFYDMLLYIKAFSISHPYITLVFSCRKLFFEYHKIEQVLSQFSIYELYPLTEYETTNFITQRLAGRADEFERKIAANELNNFLYHPFYLVNLIEGFLDSPGQIPSSKAGVVEQFIDKSYNGASQRRLSGGKALKDKRIMYRQAIQKLAFALQLAGTNAISEEELQHLFSEEERELLQHNSLITAHLEQWSFSNALFQEHLAALALSKMNFETILSYISVGKRVKKVKTKWIQTVASLLSMLHENDSNYQKLLDFLADDNIELLFTTERTKFSEDQRTDILHKLLDRCTLKDIRPVLIYESRIALFIERDRKGVAYLIEKFNKPGQSEVIKIVICGILSELGEFLGLEKIFYEKALAALEDEESPYTAGRIVTVLARFDMGDKSTADYLIGHRHSKHHDFRKTVYEFLITKNYVDDYYQYGLNGMEVLIEYNRGISHAGSEFWFTHFLLKTERSGHLKKLIEKLSDKNWMAYFDRHSIRQGEMLQEVCKIATAVFQKDPTIALSMANLLRKQERYQYRRIQKIVFEFFDNTMSHSFAVRLLIENILQQGNWDFVALIREPIKDYLLWEWETGDYSVYTLRSMLNGLVHEGQQNVADALRQVFDSVVEGKLNEYIPDKYDEYVQAEEKKRANDIKYIQSTDSFREGIIQFFKAYGKEEIPEEEIFVDFEDRTIRKQSDSNFIYRFLALWIGKGKKAKLSRALQVLNVQETFDYFRAHEIADYNFQGRENENILKDIARKYFQTHIATLDFVNCIVQSDNHITWQRKQFLVGDLFEKFEFDAPAPQLMELVWVDQGGTRNFETADLNKKKSITQKLIAKLSEDDLPYFRQKILDNLKIGIKSNAVLGNHIGLCRHLKIYEAKNILTDILVSVKGDELSKVDVLDIFLELNGDLDQVLPYFQKLKDFNFYSYFHFVRKFIDAYPSQVYKSLRKCMASAAVTKENKVKAAQFLCTLGDMTGFKYLADELRQNYKAPYTIQSFSKMAALDTRTVLAEIEDLGYLLVDPAGVQSHFSESARSIMFEWLQIFALKGEEDLSLVQEFFEQTYQKIKDKYPNAKQIFWQEEQVIEKFRSTEQTLFTFQQIKPIINGIEF